MRKPILTSFLLLGFVLMPCCVWADDEAVVGHVDKFGGGDRCCSDCNNLSWGNDCSSHLKGKLNGWNFDRVTYHYNKGIDFEDWADKDEHSKGEDHKANDGVDSADVGYIYTHGSRLCDAGDNTYRSRFKMGDSRNNRPCDVRYGNKGSVTDAEWGDTDLNMLILDACQTVHWCVAKHGGYYRFAKGNLSIINGWHGISHDSRKNTRRFKRYVDNSKTSGVGDNWVDDLTDLKWGDDVCATSIVYRDSKSEANSLFDHGGLKDWKTPGSHNKLYFYYWEGCDPDGGEELDNL
jgi:hypothetical protein